MRISTPVLLAAVAIAASATACGAEDPGGAAATATAVATPAKLTTEQLRERLAAGTVRIATKEGDFKGGGSGFALPNGDIVTNAHVVEGSTSRQILFDGKRVSASILAADTCNDVAVLHPTEKLGTTALPFSNDTDLVDDEVLTAGFPVSARGSGGASREIQYSSGMVTDVEVSSSVVDPPQQGLVEFDALLRPGNSGGVLANDKGEIIGMNTLRELDQSGAATGPSYAIGVARLKSLLPQLTAGVSTVDRVGWNLEVLSADEIAEFDDLNISPYRQAVRVTGVRTGSQAYKADVRTGDYIIEIEGERVRDIGDVCNVLTASSPGDQLRFREIYLATDGDWYDDSFKLKLK